MNDNSEVLSHRLEVAVKAAEHVADLIRETLALIEAERRAQHQGNADG